MKSGTLGCIILSVVLPVLLFGETPAKSIRAVRTNVPPVIDGALTDSVWKTAPAVLDFMQFDPEEGQLPTEVTAVRVLYDDHALYIGVICYDAEPGKIVRQLSRRDRTTEADRFSVMIDSYHDHKTAFLFSTNVSGVQSDGVLSQNGLVYDITWDAVWAVKTRQYQDGWSAEFEIPYSALRFTRSESGEYTWGINFRRYISRKYETDEWVLVPRNAVLPGTISAVSPMGHLMGVSDITPPLNLSLIPYVSGKGRWQTGYSSVSSSPHITGDAGLDIKYGLSSNFTLDGTINPDFGQVEVDEAILNLTVFETRYPEKRPFFIEGSQMFVFGSSIDNTAQTTGIPLALFFSRRIGRRPAGSASVPDSVVVDNPLVTPILGAMKVTGRTDGGLSVGVISAATADEHATLRASGGGDSSVLTEPRALYNVVRLKQDFDGGSWLGALATVTGKDMTLPAFSGGVDWNLRLDEGAYAIDGYVAGAHSSSTLVNPDGGAGRFLVSRIAGDHWVMTGSADFFTRTFDCNDAGFFAQPHDRGGYVQMLYRENFSTGVFRRYSIALNPELRWNWDGIRTHSQVELDATGLTTGFWTLGLAYDYLLPSYDDAERDVLGIYRHPAGHEVSVSLTSDPRKDISGSLTGTYGVNDLRKRNTSLSLSLTLRPIAWMEFTPLIYFQSVRREETAVFDVATGQNVQQEFGGVTSTVFGDRALDEVDIALRGTISFTRTLSLQFFSQVLIARGAYANYRRLIGESSFAYSGVPTRGYDFNETTFNANVLLRWEFMLGSTAYLVWTQSRFGDSGLYATSYERRFRETFALPHEDVLVLKLSYWLPF